MAKNKSFSRRTSKSVSFLAGIAFLVLLTQTNEAGADSKVLELSFTEGSGSIVHDSSGLGNNATINGVTWVQLSSGKWALNFSGSGNTLSCNYSPSLDISGTNATLTLEAWINPYKLESGRWIGTAGGGGEDGGYAFYHHQTYNALSGYVEGISSAPGYKAFAFAQTKTEINRWYNVVYTYDGYNGKIYLDGELGGQDFGPWAGGVFASRTHLPFQVFSSFGGMIGKITIYDYSLSAAQIKNIYLSERGTYLELPANPTVYVIPPITDRKVLPLSLISGQYISKNITLRGSPGEYMSTSFAIYAPNNISSMTVSASDLIGSDGTIRAVNVDIKVVKVWYQIGATDVNAGYKQRLLTPELLLKDDSLVNVSDNEDYVKLTNGTYLWVSKVDNLTGWSFIPVSEMPVKDDSPTLLPLDIPAGTNKQFWITIKIPDNATAGTYNGTIQLNRTTGTIGTIQLTLTVLPIRLSRPDMEYALLYTGELDYDKPNGTISGVGKSEGQMYAELTDMFQHGVTDPSVLQGSNGNHYRTQLGKVLSMRSAIGMNNSVFYDLATVTRDYGTNLTRLRDFISEGRNFTAPYGVTEYYVFGNDETTVDDPERDRIDAVHQAGGKVFVGQDYAQAHIAADILDIASVSLMPNRTLAEEYHNNSHKIYNYANPQAGAEIPETYRRNYGLLLWQYDYDGSTLFAYMNGQGNVWNDFDHLSFKDHNFAYPTMNGTIDTIQWEGFRQGINDVRYITTLLETINASKSRGGNTTEAENWVAALKSTDLTTRDLDEIRSRMIDYTLSLQDSQTASTTTTTTSTSSTSSSTRTTTSTSSTASITSTSRATSTTTTISSTTLATTSTSPTTVSVATSTTLRIPGDANHDRHVDYDDLLILAASYDRLAGESRFDSRADFNTDGSVGYADLLILAENYGA